MVGERADPPTVLLVNPMDRIRPEVKKLTSGPVTDNIDLQVLLPEKCRENVASNSDVTYRFYDATFVPNIRYTIPGSSFLRTIRRQSATVDIVHTLGYVHLPSLLATLGTPSHVSNVITVDAFPGESWSYGNRLVDTVAKGYTHLFARRMFDTADALVGLGEYSRSDFEKFAEQEAKISIIPNGVDTDTYSPALSQQSVAPETDGGGGLIANKATTDASTAKTGAVDLLYVGRLDTVKGVGYLLEAMSLLSAHDQRFKLTIVGDGSRRADWESRCDELGIADSVVFEGWQDDVVPYYRAHDMLVLPSISEGLPTVLTEAQACEIPVVSTDVGGASEQVRGGEIVPTEDAKALADAIGTLAATDLGRRGTVARQHIVDNYSLTGMAESYVQLYEALQD